MTHPEVTMAHIDGRLVRRIIVGIVLAIAGFLACLLGYQRYEQSQWVAAMIEPYNHTDVGVGDFFVDETWGGISDPHSGGGSSLCCVSIPLHWHDGLQVTVKWQKDGSDSWITQRVTIPRYDKPAAFQVHFMKNDIVKVVIFDRWPNQPSHPLYQELNGNKP
jgi:hypothetical protein